MTKQLLIMKLIPPFLSNTVSICRKMYDKIEKYTPQETGGRECQKMTQTSRWINSQTKLV